MLKRYSVAMSTPKNQFGESKGFDLETRRRLASFFRDRREAAGLSLEAVAKELCPENPSLLSSYESGETPIALDDIFALTNILNIPPDDVLGLIFDLYGEPESY